MRYTQPSGSTRVAKKFLPLGLTSLIRFDVGRAIDLITGEQVSVTGSPTEQSGQLGLALKTAAVTDNWSIAADSTKILSTSGNTLVLIVEKSDATNRESFAFSPNYTVGGETFGAHIPWSDGTLYFDFGGQSGANRLAITGLSFTGPQVYVLSGGPLGIYVYRNGLLLGSQSTAITRTGVASNFWINKGTGFNGDLSSYSGVAVFNQQLPLDLQRDISANPSQLFEDPNDDILAAVGVINLLVDNAAHAHSADNLALTQTHVLVVADGAHAHSVDNLALTQTHVLVVADAAHAHSADNITLTQAHVLVVADAAHAHIADNVTLTVGGIDLVVADAAHAHSAENLSLTQAHVLAMADALHGVLSDSLNLTQLHVLVVSDALHAQIASNLTLTTGNITTPASRILLIAGETRTLAIVAESRLLTIH